MKVHAMKDTLLIKQCIAVFLSVCLGATHVWATATQYTLPGTAVTFADSFQTPTAQLTLSALASGAGRYSNRYDKGAGAQPALWQIACHLQLTGTNIVGATVEIYIVHWD